MILTDFHLAGFQRIRCWIDETPQIPLLQAVTQTLRIESSSKRECEGRSIALEWLAPKGTSLYGFLGAEIRPAKSGFEIEVASTSTPLGRFEDSIASNAAEEVRCGLLDEYAPAVLDGMRQAAIQQQELPGARVICNLGACGTVGSNRVIFQALGRAVLGLLVARENLEEKFVGSLMKL